MRLLIIDEDARYRTLLRHHLACRWAEAVCFEHDPAADGALAREIRAHGFDAAIVSAARGLGWLAELARRPGFPPLVFLAAGRDAAEARRARTLGAWAVLRRDKVDHDSLIEAVGSAAAHRARSRAAQAVRGPDGSLFGDARIPDYRCVRRLAHGHSSELYLAESGREPRLRVIKVARAKLDGGELDLTFKRFLLEHDAVRRIDSRCVVRVHDLGVSDEHAYLVMEYFPRGDLGKRMREGLSAAAALRFALEIARALEAVHAAGVIHRDLKPGNVMLREDDSLALIDFGLALEARERLDAAERQLICGTPHYMSPEQGHAEPIDARSDLYSLGVMLYEMLAGRKPYSAPTSMGIIYLHRKAPIPGLPEPLAWLSPCLARLLGKTPAERFACAAEAAEALERALGSLDNSLQAAG